MKLKIHHLLLAFTLSISPCLFFTSCKKGMNATNADRKSLFRPALIYTGFPETFESGSKTGYGAANVTLSTGSWNLNDALIDTSASDARHDFKSICIENTGSVSMNFDVSNGASSVSLYYARYGSDAASTFELWASINAGTAWSKVGSTITASGTVLTQTTFTTFYYGNVRFQIRKTGGGKLNIDDISIIDNPNDTVPTRDNNLAMGNPSNALANINFPDNYLMVKSQYVLSYNNSKGEPNWVSWHLSSAWKGSAQRCDCFIGDTTLPAGFFRSVTANYTNTGFDRGHQCPSEDRDGSNADNAATFFMTNIMPQAPNLNEVTWAALETYCRTLMSQGNELYIIAGGYGSGGSGDSAGVKTTIDAGKINVPAHCWKIIVVLPIGRNEANSARIIAVDMPNTNAVNKHTWDYYRTSVDAIEAATGYDFLSNISVPIQSVIEASVDNGPTQ